MITQTRNWFATWHDANQLMLVTLLVNMIDFTTTKVLVERHGMEVEMNALLYKLMTYYGSTWPILWAKLFVIGIAWFMIYKHYIPEKHKAVVPTLIIVLCCYVGISIWNYTQILL